MAKLTVQARKEPLSILGTMLLFILGAITFPTKTIVSFFCEYTDIVGYISGAVVRFAFGGLMLYFVGDCGFKINDFSKFFRKLLFALPCFVVAVNNFPFVTVLGGEASVTASAFKIICFVVYCLSIGFLEETAFRGLVLPLCMVWLKDKKHSVFWSVVASSAIFGCCHFVNLLGGAGFGATIMQVGYSFLIGAMCGIVMVKTRNIWLAVSIHAVYDICGMMVDECGQGNYWVTASIVLTAVVAVLVVIYMIIALARAEKDYAYAMIPDLGDGQKTE